MSLFERNILFYSDYCIHSTNFINKLLEQQDLFDSFVRINIDVDQTTKKRPPIFYTVQDQLNFKISEVPTIVVNNANYILSGIEAFKWLEYHVKKMEEEKNELTAFNPNEMGAFSDSYSPLGNDNPNNASEQSFKFLGKPDQKIETPQEQNADSISQEDYNKKQQEREAFDNLSVNPMRKNLNARQETGMPQMGQMNMPQMGQMNMQQMNQMPQMGQMNMPQMGQMNMPQMNMPQMNMPQMGQMGMQQNGGRHKQKEMDSKLQQLILERQATVSQPPRYNEQMVDFKRGMVNNF